MKRSLGILIACCVTAGCGEGHAAGADSAQVDAIARARQDSINHAQPGYVIDSILPIQEQLRRFRADLPDTLRDFEGGESSRDALVRSFARSLEVSDTAALLRLTISRAEFAWLVYPDSPLSERPYQQAPDVAWMRHAAASGAGLGRLLDRLGGMELRLQSWSCLDEPGEEGANTVWRDCGVRFGTTQVRQQTLRLFSSIIERNGRFKILSYANDF
jgi:hypothetical protein